MQFSRELRDDVLAGDITLSVRLWKRPQVKPGGRYRVGPGLIEIDVVELVPFAAITAADVRGAGEPDRETLYDAPVAAREARTAHQLADVVNRQLEASGELSSASAPAPRTTATRREAMTSSDDHLRQGRHVMDHCQE